MGRCGCVSAASCLCSVTAGDGLVVSGAGGSGDPFTPALSLLVDTDQLAVITSGKLMVPGGGARVALGTVTAAQNGARTMTTQRSVKRQLGKEVDATILGSITQAGSAGSDIVITASGLPAPAQGSGHVGTFRYFRTATGWYAGVVVYAAGGALRMFDGGGNNGAIGTAPSFATANGETFEIQLRYDAA